MVLVVECQRHADLTQVFLAAEQASVFPRLRQHQEQDQECEPDDDDHDDDFDKGEAAGMS